MQRQLTQYHAQYSKAISWDEIELDYVNLVNNYAWPMERVIALVQHIKSSGLSNRLFACTSMGRLRISIYEPIEWNRETLEIEFYGEKDGWHFTYRPRPDQPPTFERRYAAEKGIEKFDNFIKMIRW